MNHDSKTFWPYVISLMSWKWQLVSNVSLQVMIDTVYYRLQVTSVQVHNTICWKRAGDKKLLRKLVSTPWNHGKNYRFRVFHWRQIISGSTDSTPLTPTRNHSAAFIKFWSMLGDSVCAVHTWHTRRSWHITCSVQQASGKWPLANEPRLPGSWYPQGPGFKLGLFHDTCYKPSSLCWMKIKVFLFFANSTDLFFSKRNPPSLTWWLSLKFEPLSVSLVLTLFRCNTFMWKIIVHFFFPEFLYQMIHIF